MKSDSTRVLFSFPTQFGTLLLNTNLDDTDKLTIAIQEPDSEPRELGKYRSIYDALVAVTHQETGYLPWDALPLEELPPKVHDLTAWNFKDFSRTNHIDAQTQAAG